MASINRERGRLSDITSCFCVLGRGRGIIELCAEGGGEQRKLKRETRQNLIYTLGRAVVFAQDKERSLFFYSMSALFMLDPYSSHPSSVSLLCVGRLVVFRLVGTLSCFFAFICAQLECDFARLNSVFQIYRSKQALHPLPSPPK